MKQLTFDDEELLKHITCFEYGLIDGLVEFVLNESLEFFENYLYSRIEKYNNFVVVRDECKDIELCKRITKATNTYENMLCLLEIHRKKRDGKSFFGHHYKGNKG